GQVLTSLPCVGEHRRLVRLHLPDQSVDQPGQRGPVHVAAQRHPVHPAPEPPQHPPVGSHHLRHGRLAAPPGPHRLPHQPGSAGPAAATSSSHPHFMKQPHHLTPASHPEVRVRSVG